MIKCFHDYPTRNGSSFFIFHSSMKGLKNSILRNPVLHGISSHWGKFESNAVPDHWITWYSTPVLLIDGIVWFLLSSFRGLPAGSAQWRTPNIQARCCWILGFAGILSFPIWKTALLTEGWLRTFKSPSYLIVTLDISATHNWDIASLQRPFGNVHQLEPHIFWWRVLFIACVCSPVSTDKTW